jgi:guanosine-3',5'-bis(diphosphate) 3'-pyrophosphohydrolase
MSESMSEKYRPLLSAASFGARVHRHQLRKDGKTPYAAHPFRVSLIIRNVFGIDDPQTLTAALLHDAIEDTTTDRDDITEQFGPQVAEWVAALTKDKRLPDDEREVAYRLTLSHAPAQVKACKLADIFDNLLDSEHLSGSERKRTCKRSRKYLEALEENLPAELRQAFDLVSALLDEVKKQSK